MGTFILGTAVYAGFSFYVYFFNIAHNFKFLEPIKSIKVLTQVVYTALTD